MEAQQTLVELEAERVETSEPPAEGKASSKPVFGQRIGKAKPAMSNDAVGNPKLRPINLNPAVRATQNRIDL